MSAGVLTMHWGDKCQSISRVPQVKASRRTYLLYACILVLSLINGPDARAQMLPVGDPIEHYSRILQLSGLVSGPSLMVRPVSIPVAFDTLCACAVHPWQNVVARYIGNESLGQNDLRHRLFYPSLQNFWNSTRPSGTNDGAVWQGRGNTVSVSGGVFARYGILSMAIVPSVIYTENQNFEPWPRMPLNVESPFAHPTRSDIDLPQRFGADPFTTFDLGQSYIRLDYKGLAVGLSNENMWWGPALHNPIVMSNNAPGFPHLFLGTSGPLNVGIGDLEGRWIWGNLTESEYFDTDDSNDRRFLTALALALQPDLAPGLYLGFASSLMLHSEYSTPGLRSYLGLIDVPFSENNRWPKGKADRMFSLSARYVPPGAGFEAYIEWARGDTLKSVRNFLVQPDRGRGYTLGLQKLFILNPRMYLTLSAERTRLEATRDLYTRTILGGQTYFYAHEGIRQGYTQQGQVIGAGIGPGSTSERIDLALYIPRGGLGLHGFRIVYDNDRFYQEPIPDIPRFYHLVEFGGGVQGTLFLFGFEARASYTYGRMLNQFWIRKNDQSNTRLTFSLRRSISPWR